MNTPAATIELTRQHCTPCETGGVPLGAERIAELLPTIPGWQHVNGEIAKTFSFKNYYQTMAFVNALAFVSHREDHHPDLEVGYNTCKVRYSTHSVKGLSENDFICAAKAEALLG